MIARSHADYAVFALNNTSIGGSNVLVSKFFLNSHTQITTAYMRLGQYIGQDHHVMDASSFVPWSPAMAVSAPSGSAQNYITRQAETESLTPGGRAQCTALVMPRPIPLSKC